MASHSGRIVTQTPGVLEQGHPFGAENCMLSVKQLLARCWVLVRRERLPCYVTGPFTQNHPPAWHSSTRLINSQCWVDQQESSLMKVIHPVSSTSSTRSHKHSQTAQTSYHLPLLHKHRSLSIYLWPHESLNSRLTKKKTHLFYRWLYVGTNQTYSSCNGTERQW